MQELLLLPIRQELLQQQELLPIQHKDIQFLPNDLQL
jgi:hypothetical protein